MEKRVTIFFVIFISCIIMKSIITFADTTVKISDGELEFTTYDTKATSGIRWKTVGFTVTQKKCLGNGGNGGYPAKYQHATIWLSDGNVKSTDTGDGRVRSEFTIPEKTFTKALMQAGFTDQLRDGATVYLNGIFQVMINGKDSGGTINNLNGIKNAQAWKNPNDFNDRFDIAVTFNAANQSITVKYVTRSGEQISKTVLDKSKWKKPGEVFAYNLSQNKKYNNKTYNICTSYFRFNSDNSEKKLYKTVDYGYSVAEIRNVTSTMRLGGVTIVAIMDEYNDTDDEEEPPSSYSITNVDDAIPTSQIAAENMGNEWYDVNVAIPGGEEVYIQTNAPKYIYKGKFEKITGTKKYYVTVKRKYILKWNNKSESVLLSKKVPIERGYSYWKLVRAFVFYADSAVISNSCIKDKKALQKNNEKSLNCEYKLCSSNIKDPVFSPELELGTIIVEGGKYKPVTPTMDFVTPAEKYVDEISVRNDSMTVAGKIITDSEWIEKKAKNPKKISLTSKTNMITRNKLIPVTTANGEYTSTGTMTYNSVLNYNVDGAYSNKSISKKIENINSIVVHTPVLCDGQVSDDKSKCQLVNPNRQAASLILGENFLIHISNEGNHINQKGYYYQNYRKYIKNNYVKFPFGVYIDDNYVKEDSWIMVEGEELFAYLPIWVEEGEYDISFKSIGINSDNKSEKYGDQINTNIQEYGATDKVRVSVTGRMYGFNVYDVSDYPLWNPVFRKKDSIDLSGINYTTGIYNKNGDFDFRKQLYTLPFMNGSHPLITNKGTLKPGYVLRMSIDTIGQMYDDDDYIYLKPKFYFIDKNNQRQEVEIYYSESFEDKFGNKHSNKLIKVGSEEDNLNVKSLNVGDKYLGVDSDLLEKTARIKNVELKEYKSNNRELYTFNRIIAGSNMQTFIGDDITFNEGYVIPDEIGIDKATMNGQRWNFEYYIPADIHIRKKDDNIDKNRIDFSDGTWLNKGYLVLNFEIFSLKDRSIYLDYTNDYNNKMFGYCNMWKMEGMVNKKTDYYGNQFSILDGDIAFYYINKSVSKDYISGGTH